MKVFRRIILMTTGSGFGPCLSFVEIPDRPAMRVIWQTRTTRQTYGQSIIDLLKQPDARPTIVDMLPLVIGLVSELDADAVEGGVIFNPAITRRLVFKCESRGIPAFGPIFDS